MYLYELDEDAGLLVGRRTEGPHAEIAPLILEAQRRLDAAAGRAGAPKVNMLLVDANVEPPGAPLRQAYAKDSAVRSGLFVVVSPSLRARSAALSISALKGEVGAQHAAFADFEMALDWIDALRPGVRFKLGGMRARLVAETRRDL